MKTSWILLAMIFSFNVYSQDMKVSKIESNPQDNSRILEILKEDKTDQNEYSQNYTCHNFAKTLYLQRSSLVEDLSQYDLEGIADEWGVIISRLEEQEKVPMYTLTMYQKEYGYYHMINAVLIDESKPELLESYIFIEPQTDEVFMTPDAVYRRYSRYYDKTDEHEPLTVEIGTFTKFLSNGRIFQSWGDNLYKFVI